MTMHHAADRQEPGDDQDGAAPERPPPQRQDGEG
jgi:hypothetical protein